jgi:4'-phosphopantetheinyl transferase
MEVYVGKLDDVIDDGLVNSQLAWIRPNKRLKLLSYSSVADMRRSLLGELLAKVKIMERMKIPIYEIMIYEGKNGKPYFSNDFNFNISHSDNYVVCAFGESCEVGIDIEKIREVDIHFAKLILTDAEYYLATNDNALNYEMFFRIWTLKESYAKYKNIRLDQCFEELQVTSISDKGIDFVCARNAEFRFTQCVFLSEYVLSICTRASAMSYDLRVYMESDVIQICAKLQNIGSKHDRCLEVLKQMRCLPHLNKRMEGAIYGKES